MWNNGDPVTHGEVVAILIWAAVCLGLSFCSLMVMLFPSLVCNKRKK